jgi:hypothetical protein
MGIPNVAEPELISWLISDSLIGTDGSKWPDTSYQKWNPTIYGRIAIASGTSRPYASFTAGYAELHSSVMAAFNGKTSPLEANQAPHSGAMPAECDSDAFTLFLLAQIGNVQPGTSETLLLVHTKNSPDMPQLRLLVVHDNDGVGRLALQTRRGTIFSFTPSFQMTRT